ncbi:DNA-dependent metalloprotease SPRTN-like [Macrosteles quadrilineatus]|uniref:DNA-dependent metalloprotease SPRTN-like n=1 Tax=Macrosteles quadrilineatus TaxID=74068 RepID=UPI0023E2247A|nr:DNA-dependent metalloprotease SPRTN-like [Macrosteles quadrilineatus]XP_054271489.1 DNA-dependent metalloprotease SPRTN-like [Macrosteles quadrilineatus]
MNSFDPDHALAIILQARFNEEAKKSNEPKKENLPTPVRQSFTPQSSLIDPEWEVTDPCPDVHGLFLAFNDRFFWGRLLGVEVKWSPQMTSCAGVCVYEGRNGLCSVRLSAPLLKLRPRSDLVETLLHEMIHAYLFVTNNNRDRDGHGPEFHKHMNRINKEAGTNISVYHSFHAEVKLYQQHWWRCNGPCQKRAPFFGMVKRARNRAPGPNDFWWADHQAACGGSFVKIREPEGYGVKAKSKAMKNPKEGKDIRNFFKKPANMSSSLPSSSKPSTNEKVGSNIFGFNNLASNQSPTAVKPSNSAVNRVVGFGNLSNSNGSKVPQKTSPKNIGNGHVLGRGNENNFKGRNVPSNRGARGGMLANRGGGTMVLSGTKNKTDDEKTPSPNTKLRIDTFKTFSGSGFTLGGSTGIDKSRSRLLSLGDHPEKKKQKFDAESTKKPESRHSLGNKPDERKDLCKCVVCETSMPREEIEAHMEDCVGLQNVFNNSTVDEDGDVEEVNEINKKSQITFCPVCALHVEGDINIHLDQCLAESGILNVFDESPSDAYNQASGVTLHSDSPILIHDGTTPRDSPILIHDGTTPRDSPIEISDTESPQLLRIVNASKPKFEYDSDIEIIEPENRVACMICGMRFGESKINAHVNKCLDSEDN